MTQKTNREAVGSQNDLRRLCQAYVVQYHPELYRKFQDLLGIKPRVITDRLTKLLDQAVKQSCSHLPSVPHEGEPLHCQICGKEYP